MLSTGFAIVLCHQSHRIAFREDHLSVLPGVTGGQGVLLGPFSGIYLILCWHLIYLITMVSSPHTPSPPDFFLQGSPNLRAERTAPAFLSPSGARNGLNFVSSGKAGQQALILGNGV